MDDAAEPVPANTGESPSGRPRAAKWGIAIAVAVFVLGSAFAGGYLVGDDSARVNSLEEEIDTATDDLAAAEAEAASLNAENDDLADQRSDLRGQLRAERSINGNLPEPATTSDVDTDLPWGAAGTVGGHTLKPTALDQVGGKWVLTVTAKNEGNGPSSPFCGDAGAVLLDASGRNYTGDSLLEDATDNCGDLQPGLSGTFKSEFSLPDGAEPVAVALYGDYEVEDEAKLWAAP